MSCLSEIGNISYIFKTHIRQENNLNTVYSIPLKLYKWIQTHCKKLALYGYDSNKTSPLWGSMTFVKFKPSEKGYSNILLNVSNVCTVSYNKPLYYYFQGRLGIDMWSQKGPQLTSFGLHTVSKPGPLFPRVQFLRNQFRWQRFAPPWRWNVCTVRLAEIFPKLE